MPDAMQIRQLQIAHDQLQDRLVMRVATQANEEFRIWLTRRFLRDLWPHLAKMLTTPNPLPPNAATDEPPPSFEQPFQDDNATYPLGATPLLTSEVKMDTLADGNFRMTFREGRERSFQLGLTPDLLHTFCAMLRAAAEQAQWQLPLAYAATTTASTSVPQPSGMPTTRLH